MAKHKIGGSGMSEKWTHLVPGTIILLLVLVLLYQYLSYDYGFLTVIGRVDIGLISGYFSLYSVFGLWRNNNKFFHLSRAFLYLKKFKKVRKNVIYSVKAKQIFYIVTCYKKPKTTIINVVNSLLADIVDYGVDTYVCFSVSPGKLGEIERDLVVLLINQFKLKHNINFDFDFIVYEQDGTGKRKAIHEAFIKRVNELNCPDSVIIMMDGDTIVPLGLLSRAIPFLLKKGVGGITVDNVAYVNSNKISFIHYLHTRFALRYIQLCSVVTVLTGRWSAIDVSVLTEGMLEELIINHVIDHPRGKFVALTGDDKSTLLAVLLMKLKLVFIPDCCIYTMEEEPTANNFLEKQFWFINVIKLNARYAANMFNVGYDILKKISKKDLGFSLSFSLIDQRYFFWTPLVGLVGAISYSTQGLVNHSFEYGLKIFLLYIFWVLISRILWSLAVFVLTGYWSPYMPIVLYYIQVVGSIVKSWKFFTSYRSAWKDGVSIGTIQTKSIIEFAIFIILLSSIVITLTLV